MKCIAITVFAICVIISTNQSVIKAATSEPTKSWNLSKSGKYNGSGEAYSSNLYSNYYFTGVSKMKISVTNKKDTDLTVSIYRKDDWVCYKKVIVPANGKTTWTMSVNSSKHYEIKFKAACKFNYSVQKA